jgi:archaellum biogenesis ATPase FlaH
VNWLWKPYIPFGKISLLQGDGGMGKTTVSLAIAAAVSTGASLPGTVGYDAPARVIIQNAEDSYTQTIRPRLEELGADCDMIHVIDEEEDALSLTDERIEQTIIQTKASLCILDPIQAYFRGANMNSADSVRPVMKRLGKVAERHNCAILLVGHFNKGSLRTQSAYRGLGSIDIYSAARSVMNIGKIDDNTRVIVHGKSNLAPSGSSMAFGLDPVYGFRWHGEYESNADDVFNDAKQPHEKQSDKAKRFIIDILANGAAESAKIFKTAEIQGISEKTLKRAKSELGVYSFKENDRWFWANPIETHFIDYEGGQEGQEEQHSNMTRLPLLTESGAV